MNEVILLVLLGLGSGALIAGIAVGVVVTYRGSGIINLALGGYAMLAGYAFWALNTGELGFTLSKAPALVLALLFVLGVAAAVELGIFRPLRNTAPLARLVASLGVLLTLQAAMLISFTTLPHIEPQVLPTTAAHILGGVIPIDRFIVAGIVIVATIALAVAYRRTRFGLATRAASENEISGMLRGLSPTRLGLANSLIAALIAGGVGILAAAITELDTDSSRCRSCRRSGPRCSRDCRRSRSRAPRGSPSAWPSRCWTGCRASRGSRRPVASRFPASPSC